MSLEKHKRDWEELAASDAFWAILSDPAKRGGGWEPEEFFRTGEEEISALMTKANSFGLPKARRRALDFGCGVGRLTRALRRYFDESVGVDISETMVRQGRILNPDCQFLVNDGDNLRMFPDLHFDMVYSMIVLQHMPNEAVMAAYISELIRILAPGGLAVFQAPTGIPLRKRLQPRRRLYAALRAVGIPSSLLLGSTGLHPMRASAISAARVLQLASERETVLLACEPDTRAFDLPSATYFVTRP